MTPQQSDRNQKGEKPADNKTSRSNKPLAYQPKQDSPMDKFNKAMQKILAVPKKDINKK
jgi:hypothetical protein